jgi:hypothetical protein
VSSIYQLTLRSDVLLSCSEPKISRTRKLRTAGVYEVMCFPKRRFIFDPDHADRTCLRYIVIFSKYTVPIARNSAGKNSVRQCSIQPVNIVSLCSVNTHIMVSCNTVTIITVTVIIMLLSALSTDITQFLMMTDCVSMQRDFSVLFPRLRTSYIYIYIYTYILRERKIHVCNICFQDPQTWRIRSD